MRARYYHPKIKRFINADIVAGNISNAIILNRFAYAKESGYYDEYYDLDSDIVKNQAKIHGEF